MARWTVGTLSIPYPLPIAEIPEIEKVRILYREKYHVELSFAEAKDFLEHVMQFIYITEVEPKLYPLRNFDVVPESDGGTASLES